MNEHQSTKHYVSTMYTSSRIFRTLTQLLDTPDPYLLAVSCWQDCISIPERCTKRLSEEEDSLGPPCAWVPRQSSQRYGTQRFDCSYTKQYVVVVENMCAYLLSLGRTFFHGPFLFHIRSYRRIYVDKCQSIHGTSPISELTPTKQNFEENTLRQPNNHN